MRIHLKYTEKEIRYFLEKYHNTIYRKIAKKLDRSPKAIKGLSRTLKVKKNISPKKLSKEEIDLKVKWWFEKGITKELRDSMEYIVKNAPIKSYVQIAKELDKSINYVRHIARRRLALPSKSGVRITFKERKFIKQNYLSMGLNELASRVGRTTAAIELIASRNGINKRLYWTDKEKDHVRKNYITKSVQDMGKKLNRTPKAVIHVMSNLRLSRVRLNNGELQIKKILDELNVSYVEQSRCQNMDNKKSIYHIDFLINDKLALELFGNYWHYNSKKYTTPPSQMQFDVIKRDKLKVKWYKKCGYKTLIIWESELKDLKKVKSKIQASIKKLANIGKRPSGKIPR